MRRLFFSVTLIGLFAFGGTILMQTMPLCACKLPPLANQQATVIAPNEPLPPPPLITIAPPISIVPRIGQAILKSHRVKAIIENQVATTTVEQEFINEGSGPAEGEYLFPLPVGAAVSNLTMFIDGVAIQAQLLDATQAAQIYNETVRKLRDPALLQYVGRTAIQAKVFPIPPGQSRKIQLTYSHIVAAENGLIQYQYPLKADYVSNLPAREVSLSVEVSSKDPISTVYSPDSRVSIFRTDERKFKAGFEATNFRAVDDFALFYGVAASDISANLLTYRASAGEDGFFMLMLSPPFRVDTKKITPKDVIIVLDQSGSMQGKKWDQARAAVKYVLDRLNPEDRFNVVTFSTGYRMYAKTLQKVDQAADGAAWVGGLQAEGGTNIDEGLAQGLNFVDAARTTNILFLTDGIPTEGETNVPRLLEKLRARIKPNVRLFAFGVGDDVNTFLLDTLSSENRGQSVYVRPSESIEAKVSGLYNKITAPVLADVKLDFGDLLVEDVYPALPLPDMFAGTQLIVTGRYRKQGTATITLTGTQNGQAQTFTYADQKFPENAGGQPFVARLWATRKIGALLNTIRLKGETKELVDSVVALSRRYGIITPYTSFLIQEDDINRRVVGEPSAGAGGVGVSQPNKDQNGQSPSATMQFAAAPTGTSSNRSAPVVAGSVAVDQASAANEKAQADKVTSNDAQTRTVGGRTFINRAGVWVDSTFDPAKLTPKTILFLSDEYFALLAKYPELKDVFALGDKLTVVIDGAAYSIVTG